MSGEPPRRPPASRGSSGPDRGSAPGQGETSGTHRDPGAIPAGPALGGAAASGELAKFIRLGRKLIWSAPEVRAALQAQGLNITPANFYSEVPLIADIEGSFEYREAGAEVYNCGLFDALRMRTFLGTLCAYAQEFDPPVDGSREDPDGFFWSNPAFSYSDAMAYYCMLRHFKPDHVLEIGSGFSTLVADQALRRNGSGRITLIEPYAKDFLRRLDSVDRIIEAFVQDIGIPELVGLIESAAICFIDSTHTVKIGSDCLYLYLKALPRVSKDVVVHTHDVFLPFGIPKRKALEQHIYWTEQYLLYAYMLDNPKIEVLFGSAYARHAMPDALDAFMGGKYPGGGGSLWYRLDGSLTAA